MTRDEGDALPDPYPCGWYQVGYTTDVPPGTVVPLRYFGEELVLVRTEGGLARVFGAFCSHLGAHLGYGGTVQGDCIRCPFHAWEYDSSGRCTAVPYAARVPKGASLRAWPTEERSGIVMVWYDPTGAAPRWEPPSLEEYGRPGWTDYQRHQRTVRTNVAEIVENVFDVAHGQFVHQNDRGNSPAVADFAFGDEQVTVTFDLDLPLVGGKTRQVVTIRDLGIVVNRANGYGAKAFFSTYTPIDPGTLDVRFSFVTPESLPDDPSGEISRRSAEATVALFEQDIPIWEHKVYRAHPKLCPEDGPIGRYRQWAKRFYVDVPV